MMNASLLILRQSSSSCSSSMAVRRGIISSTASSLATRRRNIHKNVSFFASSTPSKNSSINNYPSLSTSWYATSPSSSSYSSPQLMPITARQHHTKEEVNKLKLSRHDQYHSFTLPKLSPLTSFLPLQLNQSFATQATHDDEEEYDYNHHHHNDNDDGKKEEEKYNPNGANPTFYLQTPLTSEEYNPSELISNVYRAARFNQRHSTLQQQEQQQDDDDGDEKRKRRRGGKGKRDWDVEFVRSTVNSYERHLRYIHSLITQLPPDATPPPPPPPEQQQQDGKKPLPPILHQIFPTNNTNNNPQHLQISTLHLLSSKTTSHLLQSLLRSNLPPPLLSTRLRTIETLIGKINLTPLNSSLTLQLLKAHGLAGNVGRTFHLLHLRTRKGFKSDRKEFEYCTQSLVSALVSLRQYRHVHYNQEKKEEEVVQSQLEDPTRWLDDVLLHMSLRRQRLLDDRNARRSVETEISQEEEMEEAEEKKELEATTLDAALANKMLNVYASAGRSGKATHFFYSVKRSVSNNGGEEDGKEKKKKKKKRLKTKMVKKMPPFYKVPSQVKDTLLRKPSSSSSSSTTSGAKDDDGLEESEENVREMTKLEWEMERDYSLPITSAFAFADSLTHGACGHEPIKLNTISYNTLIKICCYRGALWRAMNILNVIMPRSDGVEADSYSYNTILSGLARVGDVETMKELLITMTNKGIPVDTFTVQAMVDGFLNAGDIAGASTIVQDMFNQHNALPPYTSHLKIMELALGNDLLYEAKRHVYFVQQLWKFEPSQQHHGKDFQKLVRLTQANPKLSKEALMKLFDYFGEELVESDFF